jgi:hypothetical protein
VVFLWREDWESLADGRLEKLETCVRQRDYLEQEDLPRCEYRQRVFHPYHVLKCADWN